MRLEIVWLKSSASIYSRHHIVSQSPFNFLDDLARSIWRKKREISYVTLLSYLTLLTSFLTQVILARLLGPDNYGIYTASFAIIALVEVPLIVRSSEVALRTLTSARAEGRAYHAMEKNLARTDMKLLLGAYILLALATPWLSDFSKADYNLFMIMSLVAPAQIGFGVFKSRFTIFDNASVMARFEFIYALFYITLTVIGYMGFGMYGLAWGMVVLMLLKTQMAHHFTKAFLPERSSSTVVATFVKTLPSDSLFSIIRSALANGINQIDLIIVSSFQSTQAVALYKVAKSLSALPTKITFPIWRYLQPKLLTAIQDGNRAMFRKTVFFGAAISFAVLIVFFPPLWFFGGRLIELLYGTAYKEAFTPFLILLLGVWMFHSVTGWFKFWSVVVRSQMDGILIYLLLFLSIVILGILVGGGDITKMALIVASLLTVASVLISIKALGKQ